jgi:hypothetical protein
LEDSTKVRILTPAGDREKWADLSLADGYLYDLNLYGAFIATDLDLARGSPIELGLVIPGSSQPTLHALVARRAGRTRGGRGVVPAGLGVSFVARTNDERERIHLLVTAIVTLDLLDYGYEKRRNLTFWNSVLPSDLTFLSTTHPVLEPNRPFAGPLRPPVENIDLELLLKRS